MIYMNDEQETNVPEDELESETKQEEAFSIITELLHNADEISDTELLITINSYSETVQTTFQHIESLIKMASAGDIPDYDDIINVMSDVERALDLLKDALALWLGGKVIWQARNQRKLGL